LIIKGLDDPFCHSHRPFRRFESKILIVNRISSFQEIGPTCETVLVFAVTARRPAPLPKRLVSGIQEHYSTRPFWPGMTISAFQGRLTNTEWRKHQEAGR